MSIERSGIEARVRRLRELAEGLAREAARWERREDPLGTWERRAYLRGVYSAIAGLETARVILTQACQRMDRQNVA